MVPDWVSRAVEPYGEVRRGGRALTELIEQRLPGGCLEGLRRLGFLLLRPDSLLGRQGADILDHLRAEEELEPVGLRVLVVRPDLFDALYRFKPGAFGDNVWLHHRIFGAGPSAAVLLEGRRDTSRTVSERLEALKGPTRFFDGATGSTMRSRFGRSSSFHAVVHTAEDIGALIYESTLFFPWAQIAALLERQMDADEAPNCGGRERPAGSAARRRENGSPHLASADVRRIPAGAGRIPPDVYRTMLSPEPVAGRSVFAALVEVQRKIVASLIVTATAGALPVNDATPRLEALWRLLAAADPAGPSPQAQRDGYSRLVRQEHKELQALVRALGASVHQRLEQLSERGAAGDAAALLSALDRAVAPLRLASALEILAGLRPLEQREIGALLSSLAENDVPLSAWQTTLVEAALREDLAAGV